MPRGFQYSGNHRFLFPIIDEMSRVAKQEIQSGGQQVSCAAGCDHCCHLLIEISWEEAVEMAIWLAGKSAREQFDYMRRIRNNAREARKLFSSSSSGAKFKKPIKGALEIPDEFYDRYFYEKSRPCPMLVDQNCSAYEVRPTACRLHMVSSNPDSCARETPAHDENYEIPERVAQLKQEAAPVITALEKDGRWGHFGIMLEAVINEMVAAGALKIKKSASGAEYLSRTKNLIKAGEKGLSADY